MRGHDPASVNLLVLGLDDLSRGIDAQLALIAIGEPATEPLARFLLGPPALHPQPRMLAAEALGAIGGSAAIAALVAALRAGDLTGLSLSLRLSEEAVRNRVARELGRLGDRSAIEPLLEALGRFRLVEAGRALARFGEPRAIPLLVACLDDPFVRERMGETIVEFGSTAVDPVVAGLADPVRREGEELRWSLERRAACARLLGEIGDRRAEAALRSALADRAGEVRQEAAIALVCLAPERADAAVVAPLIEGLETSDATEAERCAEALTTVPHVALGPLVEMLGREAEAADADEHAGSWRLRIVARTLVAMGDDAKRAVTELTRHPSAVVRGITVACLGDSDDGALARSVIRRALDDPDRRVRLTAAALQRRAAERRAASAANER